MKYQGFFKPINPQKYKGDPTNIIYRSSWELKMMIHLDHHQDVEWWQSEETIVRYRSPVDNKIHRYFIDFTTKVRTKDGKTKILLIEVKPKYQTVPPILEEKKQKSKKYVREVINWAVNSSKWKAAREYAQRRGYEFIIMTEDDLGIRT